MVSPRLRVMAGEEVLGIFNEQRVDVHHMALDLQVVGAPAELDQRPGDDIHEAPGELAKRRRVAFAAELAGNPSGDFRDATETADGVVACGNLRPAQMEDVELVLTAGASRFHVHALEQVGIAFGVEDDHHFLARPVDVLGDVDLGQARLADPGSAQDQGMAHALAQRQGGFLFVGLDAVQQRGATHGRQWSYRVEWAVPGGYPRQDGEPWRCFSRRCSRRRAHW